MVSARGPAIRIIAYRAKSVVAERLLRLRAKIIVNPAAGMKIFQKRAERIVETLGADGTFERADRVRTSGPGDAYRAARDMGDGLFDIVFAAGGDGTVFEVVNGLIDGGHKTPLAILPTGTSNVFANYLKIPQGVREYRDMVRGGLVAAADVGQAGSRHFLGSLSAGLLTDISYKAPIKNKNIMGQLAYLVEAVQTVKLPEIRPMAVRMSSKDMVIEEEALLFIITNSPNVGIFSNLAPQASISDGLLDVFVICKQSLSDFASLLLQFVKGTHAGNPSVRYFQTGELTIESLGGEPVTLDIDGEKGDALPVTVKAVPRMISLIVPPQFRAVRRR